MSKGQALFASAKAARENAYSPYSGHKVGAAILTSDGKVFSGCNVENASYGATTCAERVAIQKAISENGKILIHEVLVITDADPAWPPCGLCRQVIAEFASPETLIHIANTTGKTTSVKFSQLYPDPFTPNRLATSTDPT